MAYREDTGSLARAKRLDNGRLIADATFTRSGVFEYQNADGSIRREYRPPAEVFKRASMDSLALVPFTDLHPPVMVTASNSKTYAVGQVGENIRRDGNQLAGKIAVNDAATIAKMDDGEAELSCGYDCDLVMGAGVSPEGEHFDATQTNIMYNHVARVPAGRAGTARARMDERMKVLRTTRTDAAIQVRDQASTPHTVTLTEDHPDGVSTYVYATDMTSADLFSSVSRALAAYPGISVALGETGELVRLDGLMVSRKDGTVRVGSASGACVSIASKTMTADQLNATLSAALSASPDFRVRTDSKETPHMNLEQALAALAAANVAIGAEKQRADAAEHKAEKNKKERQDMEAQLTAAQSALAAEKTRADAADKARTDAEKARTDAAANFDARVSARSTLIANAIGALGRNDKGEVLSVDGKSTVKLDAMPDRDIRVAVVAKLDGMTIPADRSDETVQFVCDAAIDRAAKAGKALGDARAAIVTGNFDARPPAAGDAETEARARMDARRKDAWKTVGAETKEGK